MVWCGMVRIGAVYMQTVERNEKTSRVDQPPNLTATFCVFFSF